MIAQGGSGTLEVRWISPGALTEAVIDWFNPHVMEIETREDLYLVGLGIQGLSVKLRGGTVLDIKASSGNPGALEVANHAHGRVQAWKKWSFPLTASPETGARSSDWVRVGKHRRIGRFSFVDGDPVPHAPRSPNEMTTCAVELTDIKNRGESWWTLGFEAAGDPGTRKDAIEATASLLFSEPLPAGELNVDGSTSYADWLRASAPGSIP